MNRCFLFIINFFTYYLTILRWTVLYISVFLIQGQCIMVKTRPIDGVRHA